MAVALECSRTQPAKGAERQRDARARRYGGEYRPSTGSQPGCGQERRVCRLSVAPSRVQAGGGRRCQTRCVADRGWLRWAGAALLLAGSACHYGFFFFAAARDVALGEKPSPDNPASCPGERPTEGATCTDVVICDYLMSCSNTICECGADAGHLRAGEPQSNDAGVNDNRDGGPSIWHCNRGIARCN